MMQLWRFKISFRFGPSTQPAAEPVPCPVPAQSRLQASRHDSLELVSANARLAFIKYLVETGRIHD